MLLGLSDVDVTDVLDFSSSTQLYIFFSLKPERIANASPKGSNSVSERVSMQLGFAHARLLMDKTKCPSAAAPLGGWDKEGEAAAAGKRKRDPRERAS